MDIIKKIQLENMKAEAPKFSVGDTVKVHVKIVEGKRERIQIFEGIVLKKQNGGLNLTISVIVLVKQQKSKKKERNSEAVKPLFWLFS